MTNHSPIRTVPRHAYVGDSSGARTEQPKRPSVEEVAAQLAVKGLLTRPQRTWATHPPPLTRTQVAECRRLRHTHTLREIGEKFGGRHPSTIASVCAAVRVDFRGKRKRMKR